MKEIFIDKFDKSEMKKGMFLFLAYLIFNIWGGNIVEALNVPFIKEYATLCLYFVLFVLAIVFFYKIVKDSILNLESKKKYFSNNFTSLIIIGFITMMSMVIVAILLDHFNITNQNEAALDQAMSANKLSILLPSILFAPVAEEFIYRYFIFRSIRKHSVFLAHLITAFLFGFSHVWDYVIIEGNILSMYELLPTFCLGLGCSITYEKTKSIMFPIMLHMGMNIIACM